MPLIGEGLGGMITNFKKATKKNKGEQAKIDDNSAAVKEEATVINENTAAENEKS